MLGLCSRCDCWAYNRESGHKNLFKLITRSSRAAELSNWSPEKGEIFSYRLKKLVSISLQTGSFNCIYFVFVTTIFFSVISWSIAVTNLQCHWIRSRFNSCATFSIKVEYVKDGILLYRIDLSSRRATTWIRNIDLGRIIFSHFDPTGQSRFGL